MAKTPIKRTNKTAQRLGSAFPLSGANLVVTPVFGPPIAWRGPRSLWSGPAFKSFPLYKVDVGSLNYFGVQQVALGAPVLRSP
jgi:hypothetical protein